MSAHQARVSTGPVAGAIPPRVDDENVFNTVQDKRNLTVTRLAAAMICFDVLSISWATNLLANLPRNHGYATILVWT